MNKNEKAFPCENDSSKSYNYINKGMDLRDYFAAKAMQSYIENDELRRHIKILGESESMGLRECIAKFAYLQADAMMKVREE